MAFVDELKINLKAGKGGDGVVRWLNLKGKEFAGPAGGNGGKGGDVYVRAVRDSAILEKYVQKPFIHAEDGHAGDNRNKTGADGQDSIIDIPVGSYVKNLETGIDYELLETDEMVKILHGGKGGLGNTMFKSSTNQTPTEQTDGKPGEEAEFYIELRLIADYGLIGLPNAGKSTLLNTLTNSKSKVGNYNFTTLEPHLGDMYGTIIADIPGLIEGASEGKGLGHKFLRHITRTGALIHCISIESDDIMRDYTTIRNELKAFSPDLIQKEEIIVITKCDMKEDCHPELVSGSPNKTTRSRDPETSSGIGMTISQKEIKALFPNKEILFVSILDDESIDALKKRVQR